MCNSHRWGLIWFSFSIFSGYTLSYIKLRCYFDFVCCLYYFVMKIVKIRKKIIFIISFTKKWKHETKWFSYLFLLFSSQKFKNMKKNIFVIIFNEKFFYYLISWFEITSFNFLNSLCSNSLWMMLSSGSHQTRTQSWSIDQHPDLETLILMWIEKELR